MCAELLANPLIESYEIELAGEDVTEAAPRIAVVVFPGSNDDRDAALALEGLGADAVLRLARRAGAARGRRSRPARRLLVRRLPARGAIARFSPAMRAVADFAADGGFVLGICNGFQVLCEAGLLPGVLRAERVALVRVPGRRRAGRAQRRRRSSPRARPASG